MYRLQLHLLSNQHDICHVWQKWVVAHFGAGSGIGKGPVTGDLAVIALTAAGAEGLAGVDHLIELFAGETEIDNPFVLIVSKAFSTA